MSKSEQDAYDGKEVGIKDKAGDMVVYDAERLLKTRSVTPLEQTDPAGFKRVN